MAAAAQIYLQGVLKLSVHKLCIFPGFQVLQNFILNTLFYGVMNYLSYNAMK